MQLISLKKSRLQAAEVDRAQISALLNKASEKSALEIEVGSGNGHFLVEYAKERSHCFFTGIELKKQRCLKIVKKLENLHIEHASVIYGNAEDIIANLPAAVVDKYHIYFTDPWPKTKHKKRRFFRMPNLNRISRSLKPGGEIYFASDIFDYYLQAKVLMLLHPELMVLNTAPPPEIYKSLFANRFTELEKNIYFVAAVKKLKP